MTRGGVNNLIWAVSLLLQLVVLVKVFRSGMARQLPAWAALLLFYPLRGAALFLLSAHLARPTYIEIFNLFSVIDLFLQFALVIHIATKYAAAQGGWTMPRLGALAGILAGSAVATFVLVQSVPKNTPLPPDRAQIFDSFLMILLCVWMMVRPAKGILRKVCLGFAFFGTWNVLAMLGRTVAASHRDVRTYTAWSYVSPAAYMVVMVFWLIALRGGTEGQTSAVGR